jgi:hypothetical protein
VRQRFVAVCLALLAPLVIVVAGCASAPPSRVNAPAMSANRMAGMPDVNAMMAKTRLNSEMMQEPDLPAWHDQREKMALAVGDRTIDKSFDRTFDSMIIALANLGCRVNNMERISGYITSSLPQLPPAQRDALAKEGLAEYAQAKGYPPSVLDTSGPYGNIGGGYSAMMERMGAGVTLTMVRQGPDRTKVKLRFDNVYYPRTVEELYKRVWDAVDKQIFLDRSLD